jgi:hypothetical protein
VADEDESTRGQHNKVSSQGDVDVAIERQSQVNDSLLSSALLSSALLQPRRRAYRLSNRNGVLSMQMQTCYCTVLLWEDQVIGCARQSRFRVMGWDNSHASSGQTLSESHNFCVVKVVKYVYLHHLKSQIESMHPRAPMTIYLCLFVPVSIHSYSLWSYKTSVKIQSRLKTSN